MPVVGGYHSQFWAISDTTVPPPLAPGFGGYPVWQASVIATSLPLGPLGAWVDVQAAKVRWWVRLWRGIRRLSFNKRSDVKALVDRLERNEPQKPGVVQIVERIIEKPVEVEVVRERIVLTTSAVDQRLAALDPERRAVVERTVSLLESPHYDIARKAVRETATTLGFDRPEAWKDLSRHMKADNGRTQNVYRHLKAMRLLREYAQSTFTNPEANLLTELAYTGFAAMGK